MLNIKIFFSLFCTFFIQLLIAQTSCSLIGSGSNLSGIVTSSSTISGNMTGMIVTLSTNTTNAVFSSNTASFNLALDASSSNSVTYASAPNTAETFLAGIPRNVNIFSLNAPSGSITTMAYKFELAGIVYSGTCSLSPPLPVEILEFYAQNQNSKNLLDWQTASEKGNEGFYIQRSADGKVFENLGFVKGNGTTQKKQSYNFIDEHPLSISYYRLLQKDLDGKETYSKIISVIENPKISLNIFPNPATDILNVKFNIGKEIDSNIELYDSSGKIVYIYNFISKIGDNYLSFSTKEFAKGYYTLKIKRGDLIVNEKVLIW
jgi:hypothetical protein